MVLYSTVRIKKSQYSFQKKEAHRISQKKMRNNWQSMYDNQWHFWSTKGLINKSNVCFNKGYFDGNELVCYFIDVVNSYELTRINMYDKVSDDGGGNALVFKMAK